MAAIQAKIDELEAENKAIKNANLQWASGTSDKACITRPV
jgi:hypothetical protein